MKVGYVRVSTVGQNTARQEVLMQELGVERVFIDRQSGKDTSRPELQRLLEFVREGDTVVVESISRFARCTKDLLELIEQLTTKGAATITPGTSDQTIASGTYLTGAQTVKGDANLIAGNIKKGVSIFGVAGSFEGSGGSGGSSDNNCEAYHITSASAKLNFKTTGTVKVWGYGTATSGYTTSVYAFVGDGYYKSASWGSPTKTSASFSVNADGTLSGLPNMSACDLLVTIGV